MTDSKPISDKRITFRLPLALYRWLKSRARGRPLSEVVRDELEQRRREDDQT